MSEGVVETQFEEVIATHERLRELSKQPSHQASNKIIDRVDDICRRFIAACPFAVVSSRPERWPDRSSVPSLAEAIVAHTRTSETVAEVQAVMDDRTKQLY